MASDERHDLEGDRNGTVACEAYKQKISNDYGRQTYVSL